jgi:hypothetical protein
MTRPCPLKSASRTAPQSSSITPANAASAASSASPRRPLHLRRARPIIPPRQFSAPFIGLPATLPVRCPKNEALSKQHFCDGGHIFRKPSGPQKRSGLHPVPPAISHQCADRGRANHRARPPTGGADGSRSLGLSSTQRYFLKWGPQIQINISWRKTRILCVTQFWQRRTNVWREVTSPRTGPMRLRSGKPVR